MTPVHEAMRSDAGHLEFLTEGAEPVLVVEARDGGAGVAPNHFGASEYGVGERSPQQGTPRTGAANVVDGGHAAQPPALALFHAGHGEFGRRILVIDRGRADRTALVQRGKMPGAVSTILGVGAESRRADQGATPCGELAVRRRRILAAPASQPAGSGT